MEEKCRLPKYTECLNPNESGSNRNKSNASSL